MKDEEYLYKQEVRQKSNIARSARSKRTHNGRRGRVRLPSDNMTEKELKKMNGEVKSYPLNKPMTWAEFKLMPTDIQHTYIKLLQEKFRVNATHIAEMMGVTKGYMAKYFRENGLGEGRHGARRNWDKEGFYAWLNGVKLEAPVEEEPVAQEAPIEEAPIPDTPKAEFSYARNAIPTSGAMTFEGYTQDIVRTISNLFGTANIHLQITWDVLAEGEQ